MFIQDKSGAYIKASFDQIMQAANAAISQRYNANGAKLESPQMVKQYLHVKLSALENEHFLAVYLDNRHKVIAAVDHFQGTVNAAAVYPREIVKAGLLNNAAACIIAHNHPSGWAEPSGADIQITRRIKEALDTVDIRLLDHIVIGCDIAGAVSMSERGLI